MHQIYIETETDHVRMSKIAAGEELDSKITYTKYT
jgi:hypothetical protein